MQNPQERILKLSEPELQLMQFLFNYAMDHISPSMIPHGTQLGQKIRKELEVK
jgi:hypothetical protein